jgi:hypothetical protein
MKTCAYCGRENPDDAVNCSGCGLDDFKSDAPLQTSTDIPADGDAAVLLTTSRTARDLEWIVAALDSAGIPASTQDNESEETLESNPDSADAVRIYVRSRDLTRARELLKPPDKPPAPASVPGSRKVIASLMPAQAPAILDLFKTSGISAEARTSTDESGLEMCEISVEDQYFDRGCDLLEAWDAEQQAEGRKKSPVFCNQCGSRDYQRIPHDKLEFVYKCKDCGNEFIS